MDDKEYFDRATFLFTFSIKYCIALVQKINQEILVDLHVLKVTESKKVIFGMSSVCLCVCPSVCLSVDTITQKIMEVAQPNLVCNLIY